MNKKNVHKLNVTVQICRQQKISVLLEYGCTLASATYHNIYTTELEVVGADSGLNLEKIKPT